VELVRDGAVVATVAKKKTKIAKSGNEEDDKEG